MVPTVLQQRRSWCKEQGSDFSFMQWVFVEFPLCAGPWDTVWENPITA